MSFSLIMSIFIAILIVLVICAVVFFKMRNVSLPMKLNMINNHIRSGNYRGAVKLCKDIIAKDSKNSEAHYFLGLAYLNDNQNELALEEFRIVDRAGVFSKNISEYELRMHMAELYAKTNKIDEALKEYALLSQKNGHNFEVYFKMGELFDSKGNKQQAAAYYMKALKIKKKFVPALYKLGIIYFDFKKYADAKKLFSLLRVEDPNDFKIYYYLGVIDKSEGNSKSAIANLEKASSGKIINNSNEFNLNSHIGIIFQDADSQILGETPEEDILFGLKNLNFKKEEREKKLKEVLSFCELENKKHSPARLMSGGEKRRLAIASILALDCDIIILDEPFANLDWKGVKLVTSLLKKLKEENKTIIILTHEIEKILALTNRVVIINNGKLVFDDTTENATQMDKSQWEEFELHYPFTSYKNLEDLIW